MVGRYEYGNKSLSSVKCWSFTDRLSVCQLFTNKCVPCSYIHQHTNDKSQSQLGVLYIMSTPNFIVSPCILIHLTLHTA